jgi:hypothetical protein
MGDTSGLTRGLRPRSSFYEERYTAMSKLVRESVEKAEKLLAKKGDLIDEGLKAELSKHLELAQALSGDYRSLKEEIKEKRLDIEENARALARAVRKAKKAAVKPKEA